MEHAHDSRHGLMRDKSSRSALLPLSRPTVASKMMRSGRAIWLCGPAAHAVLESWREDEAASYPCELDSQCLRSAHHSLRKSSGSGQIEQDLLGSIKDWVQDSNGFIRLESPGILNIASSFLSRPDGAAQGDAKPPSSERSSTSSTQDIDTPAHRESHNRRFSKAAELAEGYREDMGRLKGLLEERGVQLPHPRFNENDAELMRYAVTTGLTTARTESERQRAVDTAAERVCETVEWLSTHTFSTEAQLKQWEPMLGWLPEEVAGHPVLVINVAKATREYQGEDLDEFGEAIVSQVEAALSARLSDAPGWPEQMVVVADCGVASSKQDAVQGSNVFRIMKHVSLALNRHYPGRLHRFYMVDLPGLVRWPVKAIISLGHPATREKIIFCSADDPRLPATFRKRE